MMVFVGIVMVLFGEIVAALKVSRAFKVFRVLKAHKVDKVYKVI
jgi:hypothetical protein